MRHLNIKQIGYYAWPPYAFVGVGSFARWWFTSHLIRRGLTIDRSRKIALGISAAIMPVSLLISASPLSLATCFFSAAMLGHQSWSTIVRTLDADTFLVGASGSFGGMIFNLVVGALLTHYHTYAIVFVITGLLHPAGFATIILLARRIERIQGRENIAGAC